MKKAYLIILDGFGIGHHDKGDAPYLANKRFFDYLWKKYPTTTLKTDGESVGLPSFQTGGSEVGHITIGAGRPIKHLLTKINDQINSGEFFKNKVLIDLFEKAKGKGRIHFCGLLSDGGIHSFLPHLYGLQKMAKQYGIPKVYIHAFLDGRDVGERTAKEYLKQVKDQNIGKIATIGGRFFAMDRDTNWEREEKAYKVMFDEGVDSVNVSCEDYLDTYYKETEKSDYYVPPVLIDKEGQLKEGDVLICFNYRTDRMRQFSSIICEKDFEEFDRPVCLSPENYGLFGPYNEKAQLVFEFLGSKIINTIGEVVASNGGTQLRISETEKFNHVTFFLSGERKTPFENEERILIPSPKCESYAEKPEMSAVEQTDALLEALPKEYNLIIQNFANTDLVGHSGDLNAAIKAVEVVDKCLSRIIPEALKKDYDILIIADHGNCDEMIYENGEVSASHTKNPVPCVLVSNKYEKSKLKQKGRTLADVAPTLLSLLELKTPNEMTGEFLVES